MTSDKLKEMIEKLKSKDKKEEPPKEEDVASPEAPETVPEQAIEPEVVIPEEPQSPQPIQPPQPEVKEEKKQLTEEQTQQLIHDRIIELRDDGLFRIELLGQIGELRSSIELLNEVLVKLLQ